MKNNDYTKMIKELHAPSCAVEKALQGAKSQRKAMSELFPETSQKKSALRLSRRALLAASIVFVCALSVSAFFLFRNNPVPIAPSVSTGVTPSPTETIPATGASASQQESKSVASSQAPTQYPTQLATDSEGRIVIITIAEITTIEETETDPAEPSEKQSPTHSAEKPTDSGTEKPTDSGAHQPPQQSTEQTSDMPTEAVAPTLPEATIPAWYEGPTEDPVPGAPADITLAVGVSAEICSRYDFVYCRIYDSDGNLMGDGNLYGPTRKAYISKNFSLAIYYLSDLDVDYSDGTYNYIFYTPDGEDFFSGQIEI